MLSENKQIRSKMFSEKFTKTYYFLTRNAQVNYLPDKLSKTSINLVLKIDIYLDMRYVTSIDSQLAIFTYQVQNLNLNLLKYH